MTSSWLRVGPKSKGAFSVAQTVKHLPPVQETRVQSLDQEDPREEGMATHSSIVGLENPMDRGAWRAIVHGVAKSQTQLINFSFH